VGDSEAVAAMVKEVEAAFGPVAVLVNNAGITRDGLLMRMKDADWDAVLQTNLAGTFYFCRACARGMLKQRRGRIINMSSVIGVHGQAGQANYAAAKAGLIGFTKSLAQELGSRGVTANVVAPGYIATDMTAVMTDEQTAAIVDRVPLGRTGTVEDIAGTVRFLASDAAGYITGAVIAVDGGLGM
jgi:3-oxoacyl-[acyl-carrier protein] reductase